jgi:hypothetical protein
MTFTADLPVGRRKDIFRIGYFSHTEGQIGERVVGRHTFGVGFGPCRRALPVNPGGQTRSSPSCA